MFPVAVDEDFFARSEDQLFPVENEAVRRLDGKAVLVRPLMLIGADVNVHGVWVGNALANHHHVVLHRDLSAVSKGLGGLVRRNVMRAFLPC